MGTTLRVAFKAARRPARSVKKRRLLKSADHLRSPLPAPAVGSSSTDKFLAVAHIIRGKKSKAVNLTMSTPAIRPPKLIPRPEETPIQVAGNTDYFDSQIQSGREYLCIKAVCAILYTRYHYLHDSDLARFVLPARASGARSSVGDTLIKQMIRHGHEFQNSIMEVYLSGLTAIIKGIGYPEFTTWSWHSA